MMFRRHLQDIRQGMDHFEQFGRSKGPQGFEDLVVLEDVVEVEIDFSKKVIYNLLFYKC